MIRGVCRSRVGFHCLQFRKALTFPLNFRELKQTERGGSLMKAVGVISVTAVAGVVWLAATFIHGDGKTVRPTGSQSKSVKKTRIPGGAAATHQGTGQGMKTETAILAGGCFWGVQELIRNMPGVLATEVGYSGGDVPNATYMNHGTHAEAVRIEFDPEKLSYRKLLEFFFQLHDPTTLNRQGNDMGSSYRSAIFYATDEQKRTAEALIKEMDASKKWPGPIVTEVKRATEFWSAEEEHQDYLQKNPGGYTCHWVRPEWKLK
jgi:peptide-methionine (S)-S-oxide reductase